jgi:hypothetical protein
METCGKTLLDTIDHLLDFAKVGKRNILDELMLIQFRTDQQLYPKEYTALVE